MNCVKHNISDAVLNSLCGKMADNYRINPEYFEKYDVKRGLRNSDGTGVMAGVTKIGNVHGYTLSDGEKVPMDGKLIYRGIDVLDIIKGYTSEGRFGFEETAYLLLLGALPTASELAEFEGLLSSAHMLPGNFVEDMIIKAPSRDIMNKLGRSVLALYSYDEDAESTLMQHILRQSIELTARFPTIVSSAYNVRRYYYDKKTMHLRLPKEGLSTAENFLYTVRSDGQYTEEEARILDLCLVLHAEHGGGNNSAFTCRVLSSSGTDTYSAISGAVGSLKGPKHGGANIAVMTMMDEIQRNVKDWSNETEVSDYLRKILRKEAGDGSGLIYGIGHAIYTLSDPRTIVLKEWAEKLAKSKGMTAEFELYSMIERLAPGLFNEVKGNNKVVSANVDMYSGFVYKMLGLPAELYTPIFAISRIVGWAAHRMEEVLTGKRIIRPAYKAVQKAKEYIPLSDR